MQHKQSTIERVRCYDPARPNWGKVQEPKYFPHKNRTQTAWWQVTTPDGKWVNCSTLEEAKEFVTEWHTKNTQN